MNHLNFFMADAHAIAELWVSNNGYDAAERFREEIEHAWDEGHNHCFHVENPNNPIKGNPYRKVPE